MTDRNNIEALFKAHYPKMYRVAVALLHNEEAARDVVHDVFAALLEGDFEMIVSEGYLLKAVRNRCLNHIRDCGIRERVARRMFLDDKEFDDETWPDDETISRISALLAEEVSPQGRRVIELRFAEGLRFAKIAEAMGISQTAVYRHLSNALVKLRTKLNENG